MEIWEILKMWLEKEASDIIITSEDYPSLKINWDIEKLTWYWLFSKEKVTENLFSIFTENQKNTFLKELELDFSVDLRWYSRFRVNAFCQKNWYWLVFRPIKKDIPNIETLWLPEKIKDFTKQKHWLVLITWSVWSWKTTTLASLINEINTHTSRHIITIEDPIEFIYENDKCIIEQREVWSSTNSFENWLKYALRQASDVILIWEMRDIETFKLALRAAETWNLVFATLHTSWASRTISRIIDMFPWDEKNEIKQQLAESLLWVVWQKLLKKPDNNWRVAATEILVNNSSIANMIRKDATHQINNAIETGWENGMMTMKKHLSILFDKWLISEETFNENIDLLDTL